MSYTEFDILRVEREFGLKVKNSPLSWQIEFFEPSAWLNETLERGMATALVSEKSRSEFLVAPVMLEINGITENRVQVFSGQTLNVDVNLGLTGECDFILSKTEPTPILREPIMAVIKEKKTTSNSDSDNVSHKWSPQEFLIIGREMISERFSVV